MDFKNLWPGICGEIRRSTRRYVGLGCTTAALAYSLAAHGFGFFLLGRSQKMVLLGGLWLVLTLLGVSLLHSIHLRRPVPFKPMVYFGMGIFSGLAAAGVAWFLPLNVPTLPLADATFTSLPWLWKILVGGLILCDVYSLGVMLFAMFYAASIFLGDPGRLARDTRSLLLDHYPVPVLLTICILINGYLFPVIERENKVKIARLPSNSLIDLGVSSGDSLDNLAVYTFLFNHYAGCSLQAPEGTLELIGLDKNALIHWGRLAAVGKAAYSAPLLPAEKEMLRTLPSTALEKSGGQPYNYHFIEEKAGSKDTLCVKLEGKEVFLFACSLLESTHD